MLCRSFWYIAVPVMAVVLPVALWSDIKKMVHYLQKRVATKNAVKVSAIDLCVDFDLEFSITIADLQAGLIVDSLPPSLSPVLHHRYPFSIFLLYHPQPRRQSTMYARTSYADTPRCMLEFCCNGPGNPDNPCPNVPNNASTT